MLVLNVGSGGGRELPAIYRGWDQHTLDIDPACKPDIVCDAKKLHSRSAAKYDAIYCSHNLEHFYKHEVPVVLGGFIHVLKVSGFANISVPDMNALFAVIQGRDIDETWYKTGCGKISFHDVIYGWGEQVAKGNAYYSHKTGFTEKSLGKALRAARFARVFTATDGAGNLHAFAFKSKPSRDKLKRLGL